MVPWEHRGEKYISKGLCKLAKRKQNMSLTWKGYSFSRYVETDKQKDQSL